MTDTVPVRTLIMGAAGRDFHNFNLVYRHDRATRVVAFTAAQIPRIADRRYPPELAGALYPDGIPIGEETDLEALIRAQGVARVVFAYSDVSDRQVMDVAARVLAAGADFVLIGPGQTMVEAGVPVIAVSAVRTGCGKSQTSRWISRRLAAAGFNVAIIRHPMPYGDLARQSVQRFASREDLRAAHCTVEEYEEYEPHIAAGNRVFAGVDYERVIAAASREADVIVWDGGNNDFPFVRPDLHIVLADPLRAGHETTHHPGKAVLRMADVVVISKTDAAADAEVRRVIKAVKAIRPDVPVVKAASPVTLDDPGLVCGKRVLVVEDGPTITHGGMPHGAGFLAASRAGASEIIDPRRFATNEIAAVYAQYPHIGPVLPAVGYYEEQLEALRTTVARSDADLVVAGTPCNLANLIDVGKPIVCARYEFAEAETPGLGAFVDRFIAERLTKGGER